MDGGEIFTSWDFGSVFAGVSRNLNGLGNDSTTQLYLDSISRFTVNQNDCFFMLLNLEVRSRKLYFLGLLNKKKIK